MTSTVSVNTGDLRVLTLFGVLACGVFAATSAVIGPVEGLAAGCAVLVPMLILHGFVAPGPWIFLALIFKPVIDLAWRWDAFQIGTQRVNLQAIVALLLIALAVPALLIHVKRAVIIPPVVLLGLVGGLSVLLTPSVGAFDELLRLYAGLALAIVAPIALRNQHDVDRFAKWLIAATSIPVVLSYLQLAGILPYEYWDWTDRGELERVSGTYQHPLGLIYFLVVAIPLALMLIRRPTQTIWFRLFAFGFLAAALGVLPFTYHRAGMIAVAAEILLWFLLTRQYRKAVVVVVAGLLIALALQDWVSLLYGEIAHLSGSITSDSLRGRGANWYVFTSAFVEGNPLNWTIGFGESLATGEVPGVGHYTSDEAHTDFLRIPYVYGVAGFVLYAAIVLLFLRAAISLYRSRKEPYRTLGAAVLPILAAVLILSITSEPMRYPTPAWYFFSLGALVMTKDRERRTVSVERPRHGVGAHGR